MFIAIVDNQYLPTKGLSTYFYNLSFEGRRPLGRPRCRWEDNIKMYLREIKFGDVD
jgi:hypothetical protein